MRTMRDATAIPILTEVIVSLTPETSVVVSGTTSSVVVSGAGVGGIKRAMRSMPELVLKA